VGGGLRSLTDYKTPYFDPAQNAERIARIQAAQAKAAAGTVQSSKEPLTLADWGPRDFLSSTIQRPSIYVMFSQAMVPLAALGAPASSSPLLTITPPLNGTFRWYGTAFLSFESEEPCKGAQVYTVEVADDAKSLYGNLISGVRRWTFETETPPPPPQPEVLPEFSLLDSKLKSGGWGKYSNMIDFEFSAGLNEKSALAAISTDKNWDLHDHIEVFDTTLRVYNLPYSYNETFKVIIAPGLEDVNGRKLGDEKIGDFTAPSEPEPQGYANFIDAGFTMLEAQFPPRLLFEYRNIAEPSWFALETIENPFQQSRGYKYVPNDDVKTILKKGEKNIRRFEEMDLVPYLNKDGRGFVQFNASLFLPNGYRYTDWSSGKSKYEDTTATNQLTVQVTDLGLTVRYGFNTVVVLVTSLSTGEPVEGAVVKILPRDQVEDAGDIEELKGAATGVSGKDGFTLIDLPAGVFRTLTGPWDPPFVFAKKKGDRAIFAPNSHNAYSFGIYSGRPQTAERLDAVTFMFSDRGLYKPGETLTFRGVDRSLIVGKYAIYTGEYQVVLEQEAWQGKQVKVVEGVTSESGGFFGSIEIPDDLDPGSYRLVYRRGGGTTDTKNAVSANTHITIAYFERVNFQASISKPVRDIILGDDINVTVQASYLAGGTLAGANYDASWFRQLSYFAPNTPELTRYVFGPRNAYDGNTLINTSNGTLSGNGAAALSQKTGEARVVGAPYQYSVEASVSDVSASMVSATQSFTVHPAAYYIGIEKPSGGGFPKAGAEMHFNYITVSPDGKKLTTTAPLLRGGKNDGALSVELVRRDWNRVQQPGVNGAIYDRYIEELVSESEQSMDMTLGGGLKVKPLKAGYHILRLSSKDREGRKALTEYGFYATGSDWGFWNMENAEELRLTADKPLYNPGDTAQVMLQSPLPKGRYLITVEREGIFTEEVKTFSQAVNVIDIPIARNYVPVVYVSIASYSVRSGPPSHTYGKPDLDKPKGYFGVTKLYVNSRVRAFSVAVDLDKKSYQPGEEVTMTLNAMRDGKALPNAELTLMAVDRGVIDLINYHVDDPIEYFYSEERFNLKVNGGDSRSLLMDPVTYSVKNLYGGDAGGDSKIEERKDFNPTAVFEPCLVTDETGKVTVKFTLPDTLTTYRITVFGVRGDLFALKESEIAAQNKINVREILPRRLRERDTSEAGVLVSNLDSASHKVTISMSIGAPLENNAEATGLGKKEGAAFIDGESERTFTVKSGENTVAYFDIAAVKEGFLSLNWTVKSDILNEKLIKEIQIEHPVIMETVTTTGALSTNSAREALIIPSYADNGEGSITVSLDATRLSLVSSAVNYLFHYPYGCMEQRSAAVMPLIIFGDYIAALGMESEVKNPKKVVENEIKSWAKVQRPDGGFPYWQGGTDSDYYVSLRVAHIYALAKLANLSLPPSFNIETLTRYLDGIYTTAQRDKNRYAESTTNYLQAYTLYVQSLLGKNVDASRIAGILSRPNIDASVLAFCGLTYSQLARNGEAAKVALKLRNLLRPTTRGVDLAQSGEQKNNYQYYNDLTEQLALILQFFIAQNPKDDMNTRLLYALLENKSADGGYWSNTAVTVRVLSAVDALIKADNIEKTNVSSTVTLAGRELASGLFRGLGAQPLVKEFAFKDFPIAALQRDTMLNLDISRIGTGSIYWSASLQYAIPPELQSFRDEGLGLFYAIYDVRNDEEVKSTELESGKIYRARARISTSRDRTYLALRVPIPSGAEILDAAFTTNPRAAMETELSESETERDSTHWISNQVIMDNEVQYFWNRFRKGETTVQFLFRASRRGVFPTPPPHAECMYEPEIFGRGAGVLYTIR
jgi:uncharacterized protein YfaS (alpha-2-macroglobulin family)